MYIHLVYYHLYVRIPLPSPGLCECVTQSSTRSTFQTILHDFFCKDLDVVAEVSRKRHSDPLRPGLEDAIDADHELVGLAEMVTYLPISSPFIRFAGRFVDEAFGVAAGYNFFVFQAFLVPFEIVACNLIINYWSNAVPTAGIITIVIAAYG